MPDPPIIPTADAVVTPALSRIYGLRASVIPYMNLRSGVYWHPVWGFRAQAARCIQRLTQLAVDRKLRTASGQALLDYVASEFSTVPETTATVAEGTITLGRLDPTITPAGYFPKGTRITRQGFTAFGVDFLAAEYETLADAHFTFGSTATIQIPIQATRATSQANTPILTANTTLSVSVPPLVPNTRVVAFEAAGGSDGPTDDFVRLFAKTFALGQYGPTAAASKLGAISATGVRHFLVYDTVDTGTQTILVADQSWGSSDRWAKKVQQSMFDADLVGFGCKVRFVKVRNLVIKVDASVTLRDSNYLNETTDIDVAIQEAIRSYFDDRPNWNVWDVDGLKAVVAAAHEKIFGCPSLIVSDASTGSPLSEIVAADYTQEQFHFLLSSNAVSVSYAGPS